MRSELLSQEKNVVTIQVTLDKADFAVQLNKTWKELAQKVNIPGFRKGKVPRKLLEMRVGKETVLMEALEAMTPDVLDEVITQYELDPIERPSMQINSLTDTDDVVFTMTYEVEPEVILPELSTICASMPVFDVTEQMVDNALNEMKKRFITYNVVDRSSQEGDKIRVSYSMSLKNPDDTEYMNQENQVENFELTAANLHPEILKALLGRNVGDTCEVNLAVPTDSNDHTLEGKIAHYSFSVQEVQSPVLPEMNDEFFKKVSKVEVHSEAELREQIRKTLDDRLKINARHMAENDAITKLTAGAKIEIPVSMIKRQKEYLQERFAKNIKERTKKTVEEYYKEQGQDLSSLDQQLEQDARKDVLTYLVLEACAKQLGVELTKEDLDAAIAEQAKLYGTSAEEVNSMLRKDREGLVTLCNTVRHAKLIDAIMKAVTITEVKQDADAEEQPAAQE